MGLLSSVLGGIEKGLTKVEEVVKKVYSSTLAKIPGVEKAKQFVENNPSSVIVGLGVGSAVAKVGVSASAKLAAAAAPSVARSIIPATTKGKVITAAVALPVAGAVIKQPAATLGAVSKLPTGLVNVGGNIAELAVNPSLENVKNLVKENPVIVGAAAAVALGAGAAKLIPALAVSEQTKAIKEQTKAIEQQGISVVDKSSEFYSSPSVPVTPQTQNIEGIKVSTRRKKRTKKAVMPSVNQKVNVIVNNKVSSVGLRQNKNYLKEVVLAR